MRNKILFVDDLVSTCQVNITCNDHEGIARPFKPSILLDVIKKLLG